MSKITLFPFMIYLIFYTVIVIPVDSKKSSSSSSSIFSDFFSTNTKSKKKETDNSFSSLFGTSSNDMIDKQIFTLNQQQQISRDELVNTIIKGK